MQFVWYNIVAGEFFVLPELQTRLDNSPIQDVYVLRSIPERPSMDKEHRAFPIHWFRHELMICIGFFSLVRLQTLRRVAV